MGNTTDKTQGDRLFPDKYEVPDQSFVKTLSSQEKESFLEACVRGDVPFLKQWLTQKDAKFHAKFLNNVTGASQMYATHRAAEYGRHEFLALLYENGARLNLLTNRNNSALHIAARANQVECARVILRAGDTGWSKTRLLWLAFQQSKQPDHECLFAYLPYELIATLAVILSHLCLAFNELVQYRNIDNLTALELAMKNNARKLFPLLCTSVTVQGLNGPMGSPLHYAAAYGCHEAVKMLLSMGADVNEMNQRKETPLFRACCCYPESSKTVRTILEFYPDANIQDQTDITPLVMAQRKEYNKSAKLIERYLAGTFRKGEIDLEDT